MVKKIFSWLISPLGWISLLILALIVFSGIIWGINLTQITPEQPIEFPHDRHISFGIQCLYCHQGASRGPVAGLPTQTKCWGCHQQLGITKTSVLLKPLVQAIEKNEPIQWIPVATVPDFVKFNHRPHIAASLNCEACHGDLSKLTIYENPQILNMGWCLDCHVEKAGDDYEKLVKLTDCGTCHY
ncbi:MAG: cytochrome c3 family protein [Anaerolineae bacterium]|nr:cytochrome c3 family protein [Anaerolineae bacterium]MDK1118396.1 cytochrome c3 family protein [Anaerolineae bacterium]